MTCAPPRFLQIDGLEPSQPAATRKHSVQNRQMHTVADVPRLNAKYKPDHPASFAGGRQTTCLQLDQLTSRIAQALCCEGLKKGDRVAYLGKSSEEYFELLFGCAKAGLVFVPVDGHLACGEASYIVNDAWAKVLFVGSELIDRVSEIALDLPEVRLIVAMQEDATTDWPSLARWCGARPAEDPMTPVEPADPALQLYLSNMTRRPKIALLAHWDLLATGFHFRGGVS